MSVVEPDHLLHGRYRLVSAIARGGMAEVWEGVDDVLRRPIAVKLLHPHLSSDESLRERFRREAIAVARLAHPNVVATFDTGEDEGVAFIVMELVRGRTLRHLVEERGALHAATTAAVGVQVADALQHAHDAGIIHRDVKPANILICEGVEGAPIQVKVADFGIARAATREGADLTQPGAILGTAKYLSPEQVKGEEPDPRSDVYALGVVLYESLTGRAPFIADTEMATAMAHVHDEPLTPRQVRAGIPRSLEAIVTKAMAKSPADRYQSAAELASALRGLDFHDDARPSVVRDPTPPAGISPSFRQTERTWLVPAAVIIALAVGLTTMGFMFSQSEVGEGLLRRRQAPAADQGTPIAVSGVRSFDPQGDDRVENEGRAPAAADGDPGTLWATVRYKSADFGRLKDGVGLIVELPQTEKVQRVRVSGPTSGWSGAVYVADRAGTSLDDWGQPEEEQSDISGSADFDFDPTEGRFVLVWITRLGDGNRVEIAEITVER